MPLLLRSSTEDGTTYLVRSVDDHPGILCVRCEPGNTTFSISPTLNWSVPATWDQAAAGSTTEITIDEVAAAIHDAETINQCAESTFNSVRHVMNTLYTGFQFDQMREVVDFLEQFMEALSRRRAVLAQGRTQ